MSVIPLIKKGEPLFRQIYTGLRRSILSGAFSGGHRLPSTRDLAEQLGISRTVVLLAYDQLLSEGFAVGRGGSGTYVSVSLASAPSNAKKSVKLPLSRFGLAAAAAANGAGVPVRRSVPLRFDFVWRSDLQTFPFESWRRILLRKARAAPVRQHDYGHSAGALELRAAIAAHLRRSRAVMCDPSEVIIVNGSQQALDLIVRVLVEPGDSVAVEDPQYNGTREVLRAGGARLRPVPVDRQGLNPARLPEHASVVFVTPSHQFPTGTILPLARRLALLAWASRKNAAIVEDDYDGEFHYEGSPVESLQGLDKEGRIIYVGTFSRTVFPALRIGYLIVPRSLAPAFTAAKWLSDRHSATLEQQTLAEFMTSGMYDRHLRRLRRRNTSRREALLEAIQKYLGGRVEMTGDGAGVHVVLWLGDSVSESAVIEKAAARGVGVYGVSRYFLKRPPNQGLMLGYSRMKESEITEGVRRLSEVL
jgi:GntR family transcriptional regulator / MocR family aminotransferase